MKRKKILKEIKNRSIMDVPEGSYLNVPFTGRELINIVELLAFSKSAFQALAEESVKLNDFAAVGNYVSCQKLSEELYAKLSAFAKIGEPTAPLQ